MNKLRSTLGVVAIAFITLTIMSCKENKNEHNNADGHHSKMSSRRSFKNESPRWYDTRQDEYVKYYNGF